MAKLYVIQRALNARRRCPEAFGPAGGYLPLQATGPKALHAVAYVRGEQCLTVAAAAGRGAGRRLGRYVAGPAGGGLDQRVHGRALDGRAAGDRVVAGTVSRRTVASREATIVSAAVGRVPAHGGQKRVREATADSAATRHQSRPKASVNSSSCVAAKRRTGPATSATASCPPTGRGC